MTTPTTKRVPQNTAAELNRKILQRTEMHIAWYAEAGPDAIDRRLVELDQEWDVERTLEANAATASLVGCALGAMVNRRWFLLPTVVAGFLLQHAIQGWCPPVPVLRRLGFRTATEIDYERYALKALRGDFRDAARQTDGRGHADAHQAIQAVCR